MTVAANNPLVQIGDGWLIGVPDGSYTLTVKQTITPQGDVEHDFSRDFTVNITGPRFAINAGDLHSRFPSPGSTGSYAALLPQVVLARATLPWERTLTGSVDVTDGHVNQTLPAPFVAVIVLDGPNAPTVTSGSVGDIINPPSGTFRPPLTLQPGESLTDSCAYIDMTVEQYNTALPTADELRYLAHIRQVDTSAKATGEASDDGWYSVVLANRLPAAAAPQTTSPSTAYLVSLEGYGPYLPLQTQTFPNSCGSTRLIVLTSWSFSDDGVSGQDFIETLTAVSKFSAALAVPPASNGNQAAAAALGLGYVPMNHVTRQAQTLVAWYRGPLVPLSSMSGEAPRSYSCSDAALRFDPSTGMLDCSYAAAWQLGRLMALADREVAQAIDDWRRSNRQRAADLVGRVSLARRFPSLGLEPTVRGLLAPQAVRRSLASLLAGEIGPALRSGSPAPDRSSGERGSLQPAGEQRDVRRRLRADPDHWLGFAATHDPPMPDLVVRWLARLSALDGVPFNHLVPDPRALPTESIRFFFLDPDWILALIDGALSIGRTTTFDQEHDAALLPLAAALTARERTRLRARPLDGAPAAAVEPVSGFLLRSRAVEHWRGVELTVYPDAQAQKPPLELIRLQRLSDSVLLCLARGALARVDFRQPIEGLQLGVRAATDLTVTLRGLGYGKFPVGTTVGASGLKWRGDPANRVLDIAGSATALAGALTQDNAWPSAGQALNAGDFALQILESAQVVTMTTTFGAEVTALPARPATVDELLTRGRARLRTFVDRELSDAR